MVESSVVVGNRKELEETKLQSDKEREGGRVRKRHTEFEAIKNQLAISGADANITGGSCIPTATVEGVELTIVEDAATAAAVTEDEDEEA